MYIYILTSIYIYHMCILIIHILTLYDSHSHVKSSCQERPIESLPSTDPLPFELRVAVFKVGPDWTAGKACNL